MPNQTLTTTATPAARRCRVLLVDDHSDTTDLLQVLLARRGFEVAVARSVETAMDVARGTSFDVLVSDIELPDGDGYELLPRLRAGTRIPAIALSGLNREADIQRCYNAGFDEHLVKPVSIDALVGVIQRLLRP